MERFWSKVDFRPHALGCLEWMGSVDGDGYGRFRVASGRCARSHRVAYELEHGPIPDGLVLMHACDNRRCVNVLHLRPGTQRQNLADMTAKGRRKGGRGPPKGYRKGVPVRTETPERVPVVPVIRLPPGR